MEEDLAPLTEALDPPPVETYEDEINKVRQAANEISWTHVMGECTPLEQFCYDWSRVFKLVTHTILTCYWDLLDELVLGK